MANSRRVQESLRVLEEFSRVSGTPLSGKASGFEKARFEVYELEQQLVGRLLRRDKAGRLKGLYLVLDVMALKGRDELEVAAAAIRGGAKTIQLRDKQRSKAKLLTTARKLKELCVEKGVLFIVNDHVDIALAVNADGIHLGQDDLPPAEARRILPIDVLIGISTHSVAEAVKAQTNGADYIAVGSIYPTTSKESFKLVGPETLRRARPKVSVPLIAIGGINHSGVQEVMKAGADAVAVISAVLGGDDVEKAARRIVGKMKET
jgi:thiamine-phosphate diphosphorylase